MNANVQRPPRSGVGVGRVMPSYKLSCQEKSKYTGVRESGGGGWGVRALFESVDEGQGLFRTLVT